LFVVLYRKNKRKKGREVASTNIVTQEPLVEQSR